MKKLVLHLGLPKTASTSIQETFSRNPAPLSKANYSYAKIAWPDGSFNSNHGIPMTVAFSDNWAGIQEIVRRGLPSDGLREHFLIQIKKAMKTDGNVIFSGENIPILPEAGLKSFCDLASGMGFEVLPIMFVRSPLEFITSMSQTRVRHGQPYAVRKIGTSERISKCLKLWSNMQCIPFGQSIRPPFSPFRVLIDLLGIGKLEDFKTINSNESLSDYSLRIIGFINQKIPLIVNGTLNPNRKYLDTAPLEAIKGEKFKLTQKELEDIFEFTVQENIALSELLGPQYCDLTLDCPDEHPPWTAEAMSHLKIAMEKLPAALNACIYSYFSGPNAISVAERKLAAEILAKGGSI